MLKDLLFALELGLKVVCTFVISIILGITIDQYYGTDKKAILIMIIVAFIIVMKILLGVLKNERK